MLSLKRSLWLIIALFFALFLCALLPWSVFGVEGSRYSAEIVAADQSGFQLLTGGFDAVSSANLSVDHSAVVEMNRWRIRGLSSLWNIGLALLASLSSAIAAAASLARRPFARRLLFPTAAVATLCLFLTFAFDLPLEAVSARLDTSTSTSGYGDGDADPFDVFLTSFFWLALAIVGLQAWVAFQASRVLARG